MKSQESNLLRNGQLRNKCILGLMLSVSMAYSQDLADKGAAKDTTTEATSAENVEDQAQDEAAVAGEAKQEDQAQDEAAVAGEAKQEGQVIDEAVVQDETKEEDQAADEDAVLDETKEEDQAADEDAILDETKEEDQAADEDAILDETKEEDQAADEDVVLDETKEEDQAADEDVVLDETKEEITQEFYSDLSQEEVPTKRNWFIKRRLWRKAKLKYEEIREKSLNIAKLQDSFLNTQKEVSNEIRDFYLEVGVIKGRIQVRLEQTEEMIKKEQEKEGLTAEEGQILSDLESQKEQLSLLSDDLKSISKIDDLVKQSVLKAVEQIQAVDLYEQKAYESYEKIGETVNREKAEQLYNFLENLQENIELKEKYLTSDIPSYIDEVKREFEAIKEEIKSLIRDLEQKGIGITEAFEKEEEEQEKARENKREQERLEKLKQKEVKAQSVKQEAGWWNSMVRWVGSWFGQDKSSSGKLIETLDAKVTSKTEEVVADVDDTKNSEEPIESVETSNVLEKAE